jgi:serine/threonine protein kinase/DNA-binding beta-propeller fold protein YncE
MLEALQPRDPERVGPYRLRGVLGSGGFGRVFLGQSADDRQVAIKVIRADRAADPEFLVRFRREVAAARKVSGRFTAQVIDADVDAAEPWLATAYVTGPSLAEAVARHGPLPASSVLTLAAGLAEALAAIHDEGLVHRDLKPENVLLAEDGPRVIDFGIARAAGASTLTTAGMVIGTCAFMSPEQAQGLKVGPPSDVFSLGSVLVFAASGQGPFGTGPENELLIRVAYQVPSLDQVPQEVRPLARLCLAADPAQRPTPRDLLARLGGAHPATDWLPEPIASTITWHRPTPVHPPAGTAGPAHSVPPNPPPAWPSLASSWSSPPASTPPQSRRLPRPSPPPRRRSVQIPNRTAPTRKARRRWGGLVVAASAVVLITVAATLILNRPTWIATQGTAYVTNNAGIVPINLSTGRAGRVIGVTGAAYLMAFKPDSTTAYVTDIGTCRQCSGTQGIYGVVPINLATGRQGKAIIVGSEAFQIAITPDGKKAYITDGAGVVPINLATGRPDRAIKVGNSMSRIAITPDGKKAYITESAGVIPINLATGRPGPAIRVGHSPGAIAITPDGATAYVYDSAGVVPINLATGRPGKLIKAGWSEGENGPSTIAITPNGHTAYVSAQGGIIPINLRTNRPGSMITINDLVQAISIAPDGRTAYVGGWSGSVYPVDLLTGQVGKTVTVGDALQDIAIAP